MGEREEKRDLINLLTDPENQPHQYVDKPHLLVCRLWELYEPKDKIEEEGGQDA